MHFAVIAEAQQAEKVFRIGYLGSSGSDPPQAFRQGLRDLGYVEGKNIIFEYRTTRGKSARYPDLAAELVRLRVDVIVGEGAGAIGAAKNASATIPIVMAHVNDPIMLGLVASLADPGGNITGISNLSPELSGKRLELIKVRRQESRAGSNFLFSTICRESHLLLPHVSFSFIRTAKRKTKKRTVAASRPRHFATSLTL